MPPARNDSLWHGQPACPPTLSVLRCRNFWLQFYCLDLTSEAGDAEDDLLGFSEAYMFDFWVGSRTEPPLGLEVRSRQAESVLYLRTGAGPWEISRADDSVPMPHTFRWREIEALTSYVEARSDTPTDPSVALLLLAPFVGGTKEEEEAIIRRLPSELDRLGLLTQAEIDAVVKQRFITDWTNQGVQARWVPAPSVGWRLDGDAILQGQAHPIALSYRDGDYDQFPAAEFIELLRKAGVKDL
jgi:hypothetical protein